MSRRTDRMAQEAAEQANKAALASEAGRVLQQRAQERSQASEVSVDPPGDAETPPAQQVRPAVQTRDEPRRLAVEEIEAREERERNKPQPEAAPETPPETPPPAESPKPEAAAPQQPPETPAAPPAAEAPPAVEMVKVKVDGEEMEVPKSEVDEAGGIGLYQRFRAADNRLKKANELIAQNRQMQEALAQAALRQLQPQQPQQPQVNPAQAALQKLAAARFGTDEEYAAAMQEYAAAMTPRAPDNNLIVTQATLSMKHDMAVAKFKADFSDLMTNPKVAEWVGIEFQKSLAPFFTNGQPDWQKLSQVDFQQVYTTIGNQVRSIVAPRPSQTPPLAVVPSTTTGTPSQVSEKEARKASIVNLPTAAARAQQPAEEQPGTPEEQRLAAINTAKKARGIPLG